MQTKPGPTFFGLVTAIALAVLYPVSFGPVCWAADRCRTLSPVFEVIYIPLIRFINDNDNHIVADLLDRYARFGLTNEPPYFELVRLRRLLQDYESGRIEPSGSCFGD